jgi:hypothetical protein
MLFLLNRYPGTYEVILSMIIFNVNMKPKVSDQIIWGISFVLSIIDCNSLLIYLWWYKKHLCLCIQI